MAFERYRGSKVFKDCRIGYFLLGGTNARQKGKEKLRAVNKNQRLTVRKGFFGLVHKRALICSSEGIGHR